MRNQIVFGGLSIRNFSCISELNVELNKPGLHLITGENKDHDRSNGAGKTSIFEALTWCLFGRTTKQAANSSGEIVNNKTEGDCIVALDMTIDGTPVTIERMRTRKNKHSLQIFMNGESQKYDVTPKTVADSTQRVADILGMGYDTFCRSHFFPQKAMLPFAEMTDAQLKVFFLDELLSLGWLQEAHYAAKQSKNALEAGVSQTETRIDYLAAAITMSEGKIDSLKKHSSAWEHDNSKELIDVVKEQNQRQKELDVILAELMSLKAQLGKGDDGGQKALLAAKRTELSRWIAAKASAKRDIEQGIARRKWLRLERLSITQKKKEVTARIGRPCGECGTILEDSHLPHLTQSYNARLEGLTDEFDAEHARIFEKETALQSSVEKIKAVEEECASLERKMLESDTRVMEETIRQKENQSGVARSALKAVEQRLSRLQNTTNPYTTLLAAEEKTIADNRVEVDNLRASISDKRQEIADLEFWVRGFSSQGIQSFMLDSITPVLNKHLNDALREISGGEMTGRFDTVTKLKSGEMREKFNLSITNRNGGESYRLLSGGEAQRVNLACNLVMGAFVRSRTAKDLRLLILDEPFVSLDAEGISTVSKHLAQHYRDVPVFLITHTDVDRTLVADEITVVKENGITRRG